MAAADLAVAALWFFDRTGEAEDRTASELASDIGGAGFPRPRADRLNDRLRASPFATRGKRPKSFRLNIAKQHILDGEYGDLCDGAPAGEGSSGSGILPTEWSYRGRKYIAALVRQIEGTYSSGFFDCTAVMQRRLMESLIIEVYVSRGRASEIKIGPAFFGLEELIKRIATDDQICLARGSRKVMDRIKQVGDTAAHDRTYVTHRTDLDDRILEFRRLIHELLNRASLD